MVTFSGIASPSGSPFRISSLRCTALNTQLKSKVPAKAYKSCVLSQDSVCTIKPCWAPEDSEKYDMIW